MAEVVQATRGEGEGTSETLRKTEALLLLPLLLRLGLQVLTLTSWCP